MILIVGSAVDIGGAALRQCDTFHGKIAWMT
jgi:hypothetical protein